MTTKKIFMINESQNSLYFFMHKTIEFSSLKKFKRMQNIWIIKNNE